MIQALIDSVNRVASVVHFVAEEAVTGDLLLMFDILLQSVREDHVVNPLERVPRDPRTVLDQFEVVLERSFPIQFLIFLGALKIDDRAQNIYGLRLLLHMFTFYICQKTKKSEMRLKPKG